MEKTIQITLPQEWLNELNDPPEVWVHEILELGLRQLRIQRALALYQAGAGSLGYAAEQAGIPKSDLICEARARGIVPLFDDQTVSEELGK